MTGRILVTGATGLLGQRVFRRAAAAGAPVVGTYLVRPADTADERLDIRDRAAVRDALRRVRPEVVVHTATGRDRNDWRTIADGAAHVAVAAAAAAYGWSMSPAMPCSPAGTSTTRRPPCPTR